MPTGGVGAVRTVGTEALPGKTTLPKLRVTPGVVVEVPPGKTTLPNLRAVCAKTHVASNRRAQKPARVFMARYPLFELYSRIGRRNYFFFGAGGAEGIVLVGVVGGLGVVVVVPAGAVLVAGAPVPGLAWS